MAGIQSYWFSLVGFVADHGGQWIHGAAALVVIGDRVGFMFLCQFVVSNCKLLLKTIGEPDFRDFRALLKGFRVMHVF